MSITTKPVIELSQQLMPLPEGLAADFTDDDLLAWLKAHYFSQEELDQARHIEAEQGYAAAIAFLAEQGQNSLRNSGPPPRLFITIPGGKVFVYRPGTPVGAFVRAFAFGIGELARLALPPSTADERHVGADSPAPGANGMLMLWDEQTPAPERGPAQGLSVPAPVARVRPGRPRKLHFDEQAIVVSHLGSRTGWVMRERGVAYLIEPLATGRGFEVRVMHLKSGRTMASWFIAQCDDLAHTRIRQVLEEVVNLTDWTQGIQTILQQKSGAHKQQQWERQIFDIWSRHERTALFPLSDLSANAASGAT